MFREKQWNSDIPSHFPVIYMDIRFWLLMYFVAANNDRLKYKNTKSIYKMQSYVSYL